MRICLSKKKLFSILISLIIILQIISLSTLIRAQGQSPFLEINTSCCLTEYANDSGQKINDSSVNIDLPSPTWNLSAVTVNFTSIKMDSETVTIEDQESGFETIRRNDRYEICGMQLNITEQTTIFAVEIYGYKREGSTGPVYVSIQGWNAGSHRPDGNIKGERIALNISLIPNWYVQTFNSPINLSPGYYCLVLDGSSASSSDRSYWFINNDNPNSSLYMSRKDGDEGDWSYRQGDVFLHKIKRRINRSYYPENINMSARINNSSYQVLNDGTIGKGNLSIVDLNFCPHSDSMNIIIQNNLSIELLLNYEYQISIHNGFIEKAEGYVREGKANQWILEPQIARITYNHSLKFQFPDDWFNFSVFRNSINITSNTKYYL